VASHLKTVEAVVIGVADELWGESEVKPQGKSYKGLPFLKKTAYMLD